MKKKIKIIGCGVSGMTVGIHLLGNDFEVEIITEKLPAETVSSVAAAIWFPYEIMPKEKVNQWSLISYHKFRDFVEIPNSGVSMVELRVLIENESDAWWVDALPSSEIKKANPSELPENYPLGYLMNVPLVETQMYLNFLLKSFKNLGGKISFKSIQNFEEIGCNNSIIINCTGLASKELCNDDKLFPIQGQIVKAEKMAGINCIVSEFAFNEKGDEVAYVIPRNDCLVLGGTAKKFTEETTPNEETSQGIIERCRKIEPNLKKVNIKEVVVGLRPGRTEIRLERAGNVIHNYGHGGGGFTVSWGCAEAVKNLI